MSSVGIVIPCFNAGERLRETVASVKQQTRHAAAVVIVNDGSTDGQTIDVLDDLRRDSLLTIIDQPNGGVSAARNTGIGALSTELVLPLDADDRLRPDAVANIQGAFTADESGNLGIVAGRVNQFGPGTFNGPPPFDGIRSMLDGTRIPNTSGFRRSDWERVGGYPEDLSLGEDWAFWMRILSLGREVRVLNDVIYDYRVDSQSATGSGIDVRKVAKARNFILKDSWSLYAAHPDYVIDELSRLRADRAAFVARYGRLIRAKNRFLESRKLNRLRSMKLASRHNEC